MSAQIIAVTGSWQRGGDTALTLFSYPDIFKRNTNPRALTLQHGWGEPAPSAVAVRNTSGFEAGLFLPASTCGYDGNPK